MPPVWSQAGGSIRRIAVLRSISSYRPACSRGAALVALMRAGAVLAAVPINIAPGRARTVRHLADRAQAAGARTHLVLYGTGIRNRSTGDAVVCTRSTARPTRSSTPGPQADFAGLDQVNVPLPGDLRPGSTLNVSLTVDGQESNLIAVTMP